MTSKAIVNELEDLDRQPISKPPSLFDLNQHVIDIFYLRESNFGILAAVKIPEGFTFARLDDIKTNANRVWYRYVRWYKSMHKLHPLDHMLPVDTDASPRHDPTYNQENRFAAISPYGTSELSQVSRFILSSALTRWRAYFQLGSCSNNAEEHAVLQDYRTYSILSAAFNSWKKFQADSHLSAISQELAAGQTISVPFHKFCRILSSESSVRASMNTARSFFQFRSLAPPFTRWRRAYPTTFNYSNNPRITLFWTYWKKWWISQYQLQSSYSHYLSVYWCRLWSIHRTNALHASNMIEASKLLLSKSWSKWEQIVKVVRLLSDQHQISLRYCFRASWIWWRKSVNVTISSRHLRCWLRLRNLRAVFTSLRAQAYSNQLTTSLNSSAHHFHFLRIQRAAFQSLSETRLIAKLRVHSAQQSALWLRRAFHQLRSLAKIDADHFTFTLCASGRRHYLQKCWWKFQQGCAATARVDQSDTTARTALLRSPHSTILRSFNQWWSSYFSIGSRTVASTKAACCLSVNLLADALSKWIQFSDSEMSSSHDVSRALSALRCRLLVKAWSTWHLTIPPNGSQSGLELLSGVISELDCPGTESVISTLNEIAVSSTDTVVARKLDSKLKGLLQTLSTLPAEIFQFLSWLCDIPESLKLATLTWSGSHLALGMLFYNYQESNVHSLNSGFNVWRSYATSQFNSLLGYHHVLSKYWCNLSTIDPDMSFTYLSIKKTADRILPASDADWYARIKSSDSTWLARLWARMKKFNNSPDATMIIVNAHRIRTFRRYLTFKLLVAVFSCWSSPDPYPPTPSNERQPSANHGELPRTDQQVSDYAAFSFPTTKEVALLINLTSEYHSAIPPCPHSILPSSHWPKDAAASAMVCREFLHMKSGATTAKDAKLLEPLPCAPPDLGEVWNHRYLVWSCSLSTDEFHLADNVGRVNHYSARWAFPLWISKMADGLIMFSFLLCTSLLKTDIDISCIIPSPLPESELQDMFINFNGSQFAVAVDDSDPVSSVGEIFTWNGSPAEVNSNVQSATGSPSRATLNSAPKQSIIDEAIKEAEATSPPFKRPSLSAPANITQPAHIADSRAIQPLDTVVHIPSNRLGTVIIADHLTQDFKIRWDGDDLPKQCDKSDFRSIYAPTPHNPFPATSPPPRPSLQPSQISTDHLSKERSNRRFTDVVNNVSDCLNPKCNSKVSLLKSNCPMCNFPTSKFNFFCICGKQCDPMERYCECGEALLHWLSPADQAVVRTKRESKTFGSSSFSGRHASFKQTFVFCPADVKFFSLFRAGQSPHRVHGNDDSGPINYFFFLLDTRVGTVHQHTGGINKFKIHKSQRLYYLTSLCRLGGDSSFGLQFYEFKRHTDGLRSAIHQKASFTVPPSYKYKSIDEWSELGFVMVSWIAFTIQESWATEIKIAISYLVDVYQGYLLEDVECTVTEIDHAMNTALADYHEEVHVFLSDPVSHKQQYPDAVILTSHSSHGPISRPKFWLCNDAGEERSSFSIAFRKVKAIETSQTISELKKSITSLATQVKNHMTGESGDKKSSKAKKAGNKSGNYTPSEINDLWAARHRKPLKDVGVSTKDYKLAATRYHELCQADDGKFSEFANVCWKTNTRVSCDRDSCPRRHDRLLPLEFLKQWPHGELCMAAFGGFNANPIEYAPDDVQEFLAILKDKVAVAEAAIDSAAKSRAKKKGSQVQPPAPLSPRSSLLACRPSLTFTSPSPALPLEIGDDISIPVLQQRNFTIHFPGPLSSPGMMFRGVENDPGELLNGERNKCFILSQAGSHGCSPIELLRGYREDAALC